MFIIGGTDKEDVMHIHYVIYIIHMHGIYSSNTHILYILSSHVKEDHLAIGDNIDGP